MSDLPTYMAKAIKKDQEVRAACDAVFDFLASAKTDELTRKVMRRHMRTIHDHIAATTGNPPRSDTDGPR